jgi:tetratricopeptide (TPR) repeat protein
MEEPLYRAVLARGVLLLHEKQYDDAMRDGLFALELIPSSADAAALVGHAQVELGDYAQAETHLDRALTSDDRESLQYFKPGDLYLRRSWVYKALGEEDKALADLTAGLSETEEPSLRVWLLWTRANLHAQAERKSEALMDLEAAREIDPSHLFVQELLQELAPEMSDIPSEPTLAVDGLESEESTESSSHLVVRSLAKMRTKNFRAALEDLNKAADLRVDDPRIPWFRALILEKLGQPEKAREQRLKAGEAAKRQGEFWPWATVKEPGWAEGLDTDPAS